MESTAISHTLILLFFSEKSVGYSDMKWDINYLFQNPFIEELLQLFITVVYTKLFKTVVFKIF